MEPYGYLIGSGYKGKMPDGRWMLFPTEEEYNEMFDEESRDRDS
jgi:hypothetical protein